MLRRGFLVGCMSVFSASAVAKTRHHHHKEHESHAQHEVKKTGALVMDQHDEDILTWTVWGEARGETIEGQKGVACVVFNRVRSRDKTFERDTGIAEACRRGSQFTFWMSRHKIHVAYDVDELEAIRKTVRRAYREYCAGHDVTHGATFYYRRSRHLPYWARKMRETTVLDHHEFFRPLATGV